MPTQSRPCPTWTQRQTVPVQCRCPAPARSALPVRLRPTAEWAWELGLACLDDPSREEIILGTHTVCQDQLSRSLRRRRRVFAKSHPHVLLRNHLLDRLLV